MDRKVYELSLFIISRNPFLRLISALIPPSPHQSLHKKVIWEYVVIPLIQDVDRPYKSV